MISQTKWSMENNPDNKVNGVNMGPIWGRQDPGGPHVGPMNLAIWEGKFEGFDSCHRPSNFKLDSNRQFFSPCDLQIWWMTSKKNRSLLLYYVSQALCIIQNPLVNSNWSYSPETPNSGWNWQYFVPCDLEIWQKTLKNNRAPLLCCFKLCASFHSH